MLLSCPVRVRVKALPLARQCLLCRLHQAKALRVHLRCQHPLAKGPHRSRRLRHLLASRNLHHRRQQAQAPPRVRSLSRMAPSLKVVAELPGHCPLFQAVSPRIVAKAKAQPIIHSEIGQTLQPQRTIRKQPSRGGKIRINRAKANLAPAQASRQVIRDRRIARVKMSVLNLASLGTHKMEMIMAGIHQVET